MKHTPLLFVRIFFMAVGAALMLCGFMYTIFLNVNLGNVLPILLGACAFFLSLFGPQLWRLTAHGSWRIARLGAAAGLGVLGLGFLALCLSVLICSRYRPEENQDAVIILGAGLSGDRVTSPLASRLEKALSYLEVNPKTVAVVTGGQGSDEWITEAEAMQRYLVSRGLEPERILMEDRATSTIENFAYSKELLDAYFDGGNYRTFFVTNDFHVPRALLCAYRTNMDVKGLASPSPIYMLPNFYSREYIAVLWYLFFKR